MMINNRYFLIIACGIMGFSWIYGLSNFTVSSIFHQPYPLISAIYIYGLGAFIAAISFGKGWRIITVLLMHLITISIALLRMLHLTIPDPAPFFNKTWISAFIAVQRTPMEWFYLFLVVFWGIMLWLGGMGLMRKAPDYRNISNRFDLGITAFMSIMLIKLLFYVKTGNNLPDTSTLYLCFPFFAFSLLALGLSGSEDNTGKEFVPGFKSFGIISSFAALTLIIAVALVSLCLPYLRHAADFSYWAIKGGAQPFVPCIIAVLRFLFAPRKFRSESSTMSSEPNETPHISDMEESSWIGEIIEFIFEKFFIAIAFLLLSLSIGFLLYLLGKWLLSKTSYDPVKKNPFTNFFRMIINGYILLCNLIKIIYGRIRTEKDPVFLFNRLQYWGLHNGLPRRSTETPIEYEARLTNSFPELTKYIHLIINIFDDTIYGEAPPHTNELYEARFAWRKMRSPKFWPLRLKVLICKIT